MLDESTRITARAFKAKPPKKVPGLAYWSENSCIQEHSIRKSDQAKNENLFKSPQLSLSTLPSPQFVAVSRVFKICDIKNFEEINLKSLPEFVSFRSRQRIATNSGSVFLQTPQQTSTINVNSSRSEVTPQEKYTWESIDDPNLRFNVANFPLLRSLIRA